ncbi:MAG TPA: hypothetical protein VF708_13020 [Pyrinomonadaceae bacterium]|jgi:hypothetical protein
MQTRTMKEMAASTLCDPKDFDRSLTLIEAAGAEAVPLARNLS